MVDTEILIVGGGIAGASTAYHLAALGRRVTLLERGEIASGASGVNAGAIDSIGWGDQPELFDAALAAHGAEGLPDPPLEYPEWLSDLRSHWGDAAPEPEALDDEPLHPS